MGAGCDLPRRQRDRHDHIDDPSEDALYMLIDDLNDSDNTFVAIQPDEGDPAWFTSVAVLDAGGYEPRHHSPPRRLPAVAEAGTARLSQPAQVSRLRSGLIRSSSQAIWSVGATHVTRDLDPCGDDTPGSR